MKKTKVLVATAGSLAVGISGMARGQDDETAPPKKPRASRSAEPKEPKEPAPITAKELPDTKTRISYAIGLDIGRNLKKQKIDIDPQLLARAIGDVLDGKKPLLDEDQADNVMHEYQDMRSKQLSDENSKAETKFFAENKAKEGVKATKSGLQYKVLKSGKGKTPKATDVVTTNYEGKFLDGSVFDSSYRPGQPAKFGVDEVIPGWPEALQFMKEGDKWQLFVPPNLAYGEDGRPPVVPPNSTLIFEI